jgi:subfamily B ATP-binding cassette protein MsbA
VLKNVSFKAPAGSTTALVGSSGSGKSTLISLAMNFNHPLSGIIKLMAKTCALCACATSARTSGS